QPLITPHCGTSPWEINFDRNRRQSHILRLPDELLLQIMKGTLTMVDIFMIRQVSFTFWRISEGGDFSDLRCGYVWSFSRIGAREDNEMIALRAKQRAFCDPCLQRRTSPRYLADRYTFTWVEDVYCSHCEECHKGMAFSVQQRHLPPSVRRCIASDSSFRLCPHLMVPAHSLLEKAEEWWPRHRERSSGYKDIVLSSCSQCKDSLLQDAVGYDKYERFKPPMLQLWNGSALSNVMISWVLPFCKVPEGGNLTAAYLLQKQEEFGNRYGD
ncbi:hypothetical protein LY76DRAFT_472601, partial [Colletotrichum caudatum]